MLRHARVAVVLETHWDRKQLGACPPRSGPRVEIVYPEPDDNDCPVDFDPMEFIERAVQGKLGRLDGVTSSSDYPGATLAAAIATRAGLPGSRPERVIQASHKWYSRLAQRDAAPEAVPGFELIDARRPPRELGLGFPCFVKPVKGAFSVLARRVDDLESLHTLLRSPAVTTFRDETMQIFDRLMAGLTDFDVDGGHFIAEMLVSGWQVTVEGFVCDGSVEFLGVVDSILDPATGSFLRFDYPSALPEAVQSRMCDIARRVVQRIGLERTLFNIEMTWDRERDRIWIIELNPRLCGQFGDLYQKVDGTNGYEVALALCLGERPVLRRREGAHAVASSVPLRRFEPCRAARVPSAADVSAAEALFPDTLVWTECEPGETLAASDPEEDGHSHRYAVLNLGAPDAATRDARIQALQDRLGYVFEPL